jgi:hypothetical protein
MIERSVKSQWSQQFKSRASGSVLEVGKLIRLLFFIMEDDPL